MLADLVPRIPSPSQTIIHEDCLKVLMDLNGSLWIRTGPYLSGRVLIYLDGSLWIRRGPYGSGRVPMDLNGSLRIRTGPYGSGRELMDPDGNTQCYIWSNNTGDYQKLYVSFDYL